MFNANSDIISIIRKWLTILVIVSFILENIFFPSPSNFMGGIMAIIVWLIYSYFLRERIIIQYPFSFLMYTSMFMYRYLPLIATILELKPITYGMQLPIETFIYEIILFLFSSFAFYLACPNRIRNHNNTVQKVLNSINFFKITPSIIWGIGILGILTRLYTYSLGSIDYGNITGKFLQGFNYLVYFPILLLFPSLINNKTKKANKTIWIYIIMMTIFNISSNSRKLIIEPIGILVLLFFLYLVKNRLIISRIISPRNFFLGVLLIVFGLNFMSDISIAMLYNRNIRSELSKKELFRETIDTYFDRDVMAFLKTRVQKNNTETNSYIDSWDERYLDNFMLNRYANMRVSDQTLYFAKKRGIPYEAMQQYSINKLIALLPTPLIKRLGIPVDKNKLLFSPGDLLYSDLGGYKVSSHVGTGLSTFGYWYFPLQMILFFIIFKLLNTFVWFTKNKVIYAPYGLLNVFIFLGMFRNANGWIDDISYILRTYLQGIFTFSLSILLVRLFLSVLKKNRNQLTTMY